MKKKRFKIKVDDKENKVEVAVNTRIYPLDVIYTAAYSFLDRAYILLDGNPESIITIELIPKSKNSDLDILSKEFCNELLNYSFYKSQATKNASIRETIMQRALLTTEIPGEDVNINESQSIEDPEGIAVPWEEKYKDE
jgi:His-Xaa-Ser system protein HxsD